MSAQSDTRRVDHTHAKNRVHAPLWELFVTGIHPDLDWTCFRDVANAATEGQAWAVRAFVQRDDYNVSREQGVLGYRRRSDAESARRILDGYRNSFTIWHVAPNKHCALWSSKIELPVSPVQDTTPSAPKSEATGTKSEATGTKSEYQPRPRLRVAYPTGKAVADVEALLNGENEVVLKFFAAANEGKNVRRNENGTPIWYYPKYINLNEQMTSIDLVYARPEHAEQQAELLTAYAAANPEWSFGTITRVH